MSRHPPPQHDLQKRAECAAQWLDELRSGDRTRYDAYLEWVLESPRNVEAFLRVSAADTSLGRVDPERAIPIEPAPYESSAANVVPLTPAVGPEIPQAPSRDVHKPVRRMVWALAACLAVLALIGTTALFMSQRDPATWSHFATAAREQRTFELADGSLLHLSAGSRVDVRYSSSERAVRLHSGGALFRVRHDASRPFRVHSGGAVIQAVGTRFNVTRQAAGSTVSVIDGRVRVDSFDDSSALDRLNQKVTGIFAPANDESTTGRAAVFLGAGDEAQFAENGAIVARERTDPARKQAFHHRRLVFVDQPLRQMVAEFNLYSPAPEISVEGPAADRRYAAVAFNADDLESLLAVFERDPTLEVWRHGTDVVIRSH